MSVALQHTNVRAMQISGQSFLARHEHFCVGDWSLQTINFSLGSTSCSGDAPRDRPAFLIPLTVVPNCRLLGRAVAPNSFSAYAPGSEHADISHAGSEIAVIVPPTGSDPIWSEVGDGLRSLCKGSQHLTAEISGLTELRSLLTRLFENARDAQWAAESAIERSVTDELSSQITRLLEPHGGANLRGRPQIPRSVIVRRIKEILSEQPNEPLFSNDLATAVGISQQSLQRVFLDWFGLPPARYLAVRRLHLARRRLRSGDSATVGEVASDLGFWELSRFARRYKQLFGELPSTTLRRV